LMKLE